MTAAAIAERYNLVAQVNDLYEKGAFRETIALLTELGPTSWLFEPLIQYRLGIAYMKLGDLPAALDLLERILDRGPQGRSDTVYMDTVNMRAIAHVRAGEIWTAYSLLEEFHKLALEAGDLQRTGLALVNQASVVGRSGDSNLCLSLHLRALAQMQRAGDARWIAFIYQGLTTVYTALGMYKEALTSAERAVTTATACAVPLTRSRFYMSAAALHEFRGDRALADVFIQKSIALARESADDPEEVGAVYHSIAIIADDRGEHARAERYLTLAARLAAQAAEETLIAEVAEQRAVNALLRKDRDLALVHYETARAGYEKLQFPLRIEYLERRMIDPTITALP